MNRTHFKKIKISALKNCQNQVCTKVVVVVQRVEGSMKNPVSSKNE